MSKQRPSMKRVFGKHLRQRRLRPIRQALEALETRAMLHGGFVEENPIVTLHTNVGDIQVELYRQEAPDDAAGATRTTPITVANFLKYVNDGDWINTFFHRSREGFVVQGGGFTTSQESFQNLSQFTNVPTDPAILNEPGNSNLRGTIAMARSSGVNSATSQFFFNLSDDNTFLDTSNQGFTVFGRIVGGSMSVVDAIAGLDTYNLTSGTPQVSPNPAPNPEPLYGFVPFTADPRGGNANAELIVIESISGTGVIHGTVYNDLNRDGDKDTGEGGIGGVTVYVDANNNGQFDSGEQSVLSGSDGSYHLIVDSGTHVIREVRPDGFGQNNPLNPTGRTVTVQIGGSVEDVDFGNVSALVGYRFETTDLAGNVRTNFQQGESFLLKVYVQDLRGSGADRGVGSAYLDVLYNNNSRIDVDGAIIFGGDYDDDGTTNGDTSQRGLIDEAGGANLSLGETLGSAEKLLFSVPMKAVQVGEVTFTGDAADELPINATILQEPPDTVTSQEQFFGAWQINIGQTFAANDDGQLPVLKDSTNTTLDVLANDFGVANAVIFGIVQNPTNGTASIDTSDNRRIFYTPTAGFVGTDTLQYTIRDSVTLETRTATVTIDVREAEFPAALDDTYVRILQNGDPILLSVLANDLGEPGGLPLSISSVTQPASGSTRVVIDDNGTPNDTSDDKLRYTPPSADFVGTETFTYTITDGADTDTATVTFQSIRATDDPFTVNEDSQGVTFDVTQNDADILSALPGPTISFVGDRSQGGSVQIVTVQGEQRLLYQPAANKFGTETFTYRITDDVGNVSQATVTVTIQAANDAPTAVDDAFFASEDGGENTFDVMANDSNAPDEPGTETLEITTVVGISATNAQGATVAFSGTVSVSADRTRVIYRPAPGFVGTEIFEYTITDGKFIVVDGATVGSSDKARVTVTVNGANDDPTAVDDEFTVAKNSDSQSLNVLANDTFAPDVNETLTVTNVTGFQAGAVVTIATGGTAILYKPAPGFTGEDTFTYTISDGRGGTATAEVTVTVSELEAGVISGFAFFDANRNGSMDSGEAALSGITVTLTGTPTGASAPITRTTTSLANGKYTFTNVPPGSYTITHPQPTTLAHYLNGNGVSFSSGALSQASTLGSGQTVESANFTQANRQTPYLGVRDFFGRTNGNTIDISYNASGATLWYSLGSSWAGYSEPKVEAINGSRLRLTIKNPAGVEQSAVVSLNDGFRIRPFDTTSATRIVQFLGGPADFGMTPASAASTLAAMSDSSAIDALMEEAGETLSESVELGDIELGDIELGDIEGDEFLGAADEVSNQSEGEGESLSQVRDLVDSQIAKIESRLSSRFNSGLSRASNRLNRVLDRVQNALDNADLGDLPSLDDADASQIADRVSSRVDEILDSVRSRRGSAEGRLAAVREKIEARIDSLAERLAERHSEELPSDVSDVNHSIAAALASRDLSSYREAVDALLAEVDDKLSRRLRRFSR